jgi:hypothetical protein
MPLSIKTYSGVREGPVLLPSRPLNANRLGLKDADGLAARDEQIIHFTGAENRDLANRDAFPGKNIHLMTVLHDPARIFELAVNIDAPKRFRAWHDASALTFWSGFSSDEPI